MAGYAATARITKSHPRVVRSSPGRAIEPGSWRTTAAGDRTIVERDLRPIRIRLAQDLAQAREEWSQATFFLFDPNSWR